MATPFGALDQGCVRRSGHSHFRQSTSAFRRTTRMGPKPARAESLATQTPWQQDTERWLRSFGEHVPASLARLRLDACVAKVRGGARPTTIRPRRTITGSTECCDRVVSPQRRPPRARRTGPIRDRYQARFWRMRSTRWARWAEDAAGVLTVNSAGRGAANVLTASRSPCPIALGSVSRYHRLILEVL
jgi:hypothetical protein